jgi:hypothetical protein
MRDCNKPKNDYDKTMFFRSFQWKELIIYQRVTGTVCTRHRVLKIFNSEMTAKSTLRRKMKKIQKTVLLEL